MRISPDDSSSNLASFEPISLFELLYPFVRAYAATHMKRIMLFSLAIVIAGYALGSWAQETICIDETDYQNTKERYTDLLSKYDMPSLAQKFLDAISATEDLKEQVTNCQNNLNEADPKRCDPLAKQYKDKLSERNELSKRLTLANEMQQYILWLKVKLERPRCAK